MIPKVIHYCWFGGNPKPRLMKKCIKSWKKYCPGYQIIEWNEKNYAVQDAPLYVCQAYQEKKWAFVTDYVRLHVIYESGGIYLDTDVELIESLNDLLDYQAYFGMEEGRYINTGLGFGAEKGLQILKSMMDDYQHILFIKDDGTYDDTPCPMRNTPVFIRQGFKQEDEKQFLEDNILILPTDYLCPKNWKTGELKITSNTISIHHASASWWTPQMRKKRQQNQRMERMHSIPSDVGTALLGKDRYERTRNAIKKSIKERRTAIDEEHNPDNY